MWRKLALVAAFIGGSGVVQAQERPDTILVLDASGSMWGQIDGVNKVVIAREVIGQIVADFPDDQNLGLTVYGHRTRGECTDIETIVPPGLDNRAAILEAVNTINPRGMTPMTDAVIAAAQSLRFSEQKATVILVSDGIETCNPDPCAAARVLEETGVDFTAHVVGFDVTDAEALRQMQCLADETGGQFLTAANADELAAALETVAVAAQPEPEPVPGQVSFVAVVGSEAGPVVDGPVEWTISDGTADIAADIAGNPLDPVDLMAGDFTVTAYSAVLETSASAGFTVPGPGEMTVTVVFPETVPTATLTAPDQAALGSTIEVGWVGPADDLDNIQIGLPGDTGYSSYTYVADGNPVSLVMPGQTGTYELRYRWREGTTIATRPIEVVEAPLALTAPETVPAGSTFEVVWSGPDATYDNIQIGKPGESGYFNYVYTSNGNPVLLAAPNEPGVYELRYVFRDSETLLTRPITVSEVAIALKAADTAPVGGTLPVQWAGPGAELDFIGVGLVGDDSYVTYAYLRGENPVVVELPALPGDYELRYQSGQGEAILARKAITLTPVTVTLAGPKEAAGGSTIAVEWTGPGYEGDFIGVGLASEPGYISYAYINGQNPVQVQVPDTAGDYEIRYFLGRGETLTAGIPLTVRTK